MKTCFTTLLMAVFALLIMGNCSHVLAQEDKPDLPFRLRVTGSHVAKADVGDGPGAVSLTSGGLDLSWKFLTLGYSQTRYDWKNVGSLSFGNGVDDPWDTLHRLSLGASYEGGLSEDWFYHTGATITSSFEKEMSGSLGGIVRGGLGYVVSDKVKALFGVALMMNSIETNLMPTVGLSYDDIGRDGSGFTGFLGLPTTSGSYHFNSAHALRVSLEPNGRTARLADDSTVSRQGYMSTEGWQTGLYYDWNPSKALSFTAGPEYNFGRSLRTYNKDGDKLRKENISDAFGGMLRLRYRF